MTSRIPTDMVADRTSKAKLSDTLGSMQTSINTNTSSLAENTTKVTGFKNLLEFGAKGNANYYNSTTKLYYQDAAYTIQASDDTQAILSAVTYSQQNGVEIQIPTGNYLFTQTINWLQAKTAFKGLGAKYSPTFIKHFNGNGFWIQNDYCKLLDVSIICSQAFSSTDTGSGLILGNDTTDASHNVRANYVYVDVYSFGHGLHGVDCQKGDQGYVYGYYNQNKKNGVNCDSEWVGGAADWNANTMNFSAEGNGNHGLYLYQSESNYIVAVCQGNGWGTGGGYGAYINWLSNNGYIYTEGNVTGGVYFGSSAFENRFFIKSQDGHPVMANYSNMISGTEPNTTIYERFHYLEKTAASVTQTTISGTIPANGYTDFNNVTMYGINTGTNKVVVTTPNALLPQGITHQTSITANNQITIRVYNNTVSPITLTSGVWSSVAVAFRYPN